MTTDSSISDAAQGSSKKYLQMEVERSPSARLGLLDRESARLLTALCAPDAQPGRKDLREGFVVVPARRKGLTIILANAPAARAERLERHGYAQWRDGRLHPTAEGRAMIQGDPPPSARNTEVKQALSAGAGFNETESPLVWLSRRKDSSGAPFLSSAQAQAGARYAQDARLAQLSPRITSSWSATGRGALMSGDNVSDVAMAARQRLITAHRALGPELAGLMIDACALHLGLATIEQNRCWPARSAKIVLRVALGQLAEHYGLQQLAVGPAHAPTRHWNGEQTAL
jgi:hypothetical protein